MVAFLCNTIISKVLLYYFYSSGIMSDTSATRYCLTSLFSVLLMGLMFAKMFFD